MFLRLVPALDQVARACALTVLLIGLVVLAGWALKIEVLTSVLPGLTSMKPNTALCFVLAGIALALRQRSGLRLGCAAAIIALGGLSLAQDVTGTDFGTDQLLFRDPPGAAQTVHPGRMSPITAVSFILLGGALALLGGRRAALRRTLEALALIALALALTALIGYAYDTEAVFPLPGFGSMALLTALALALLALGILCARADGLAGVFASDGLGGQVARRFLPLALIAPVLLGGLVRMGAGAGLFDVTHGTAVFAAATVLVLVALSWRNALSLEALDAERKQAEDALRESEAFSRSIIKSSPDCIKVLDLEGNLLSLQSGQELLGIEDAEPFLNKSWLDFWTGEEGPAAQAAVESAAAGRAGAFVGFFRTLRGEPKWWDVAISPILDADGKPERLLAVSRDVTLRKQGEQTLRESEQRLRAMVMGSSDVMCRMSPDWTSMRQIYDKNFVVATDVSNDNWLQTFVYRDDQPKLIAAVNTAIRTKSLFEMEHRVRRADGSWGWMLSRAVPLLDAKGDITEWFGTGSDVTEKKRAEQALRESEERLRLAAEAAHFGMYDREMHGAYFHISAEIKQILGYEPDALLNPEQVISHIHPDDRQAGVAAFQRACDPASDGRIAAEQRIVRRDGTVRWISTVGQVLFEDGAPKRSIGFWVDITARKAAELALRAANLDLERRVEERTQALADKAGLLERASRVKSEFLASMSHELRTPLNGIIGFTEFLHDEKPGPLLPKQKEYLNDVLDSARHLLELINEVLDIAKVEAGKIEFHPSSFSVAQAIEEARTVIQGGADKKRIGLHVAVGGGLDAVMLDPLRFKQVLHNLLSNAVKFSDAGDRVEIHARRLAPNQLEVQVRDTGIGIKAADLGRLFTEFGRLDSGAVRRAEGTGLGLALTKKLVELQGGRIHVRSVIGEGSVFTVLLPLAAGAGQSA